MNDEDIKKALECCAYNEDCESCPRSKYCDGVEQMIHALDLISRQQERIEELEIITGLANNRKYYRKFVDEVFCKQKGKELSEPDFDYIYQLYFEQQAVIDDLKRDTVPKLQDSLNRANKYGVKLERENARLKAEIKKMQKYNAYVAFEQYNKGRTEAIKEFAEKLKKRQRTFIDEEYAYEFIPSIEIDVLLAEKVGEQNA